MGTKHFDQALFQTKIKAAYEDLHDVFHREFPWARKLRDLDVKTLQEIERYLDETLLLAERK